MAGTLLGAVAAVPGALTLRLVPAVGVVVTFMLAVARIALTDRLAAEVTDGRLVRCGGLQVHRRSPPRRLVAHSGSLERE